MGIETIAVLAEIMPESVIIEMIEKGISQYKISKDLSDLAPGCMLVMTKMKLNHSGIKETLKEVNEHEQVEKLRAAMQGN